MIKNNNLRGIYIIKPKTLKWTLSKHDFKIKKNSQVQCMKFTVWTNNGVEWVTL